MLVVDKPSGPTSFDVVARVKRLLRADKTGHTGTLDPLASGVLVVCVGEAVKLQHYLVDGEKSYDAVVAFGAATETEDAEGAVVARGDPAAITADIIRGALPHLIGEIEQLPPMYSAVRVGGRRLHEAARAGESVSRVARKVRVDRFELVELLPRAGELLLARLSVRCGKGTYVRTLASELGRLVGVPAHLASLRRTVTSSFTLADAMPLAELERLGSESPQALLDRLLPPEEALRDWPAERLTSTEVRDIRHGKALPRPDGPSGPCRALDPEGRLVAVCERGDGLLRPLRVLGARH